MTWKYKSNHSIDIGVFRLDKKITLNSSAILSSSVYTLIIADDGHFEFIHINNQGMFFFW